MSDSDQDRERGSLADDAPEGAVAPDVPDEHDDLDELDARRRGRGRWVLALILAVLLVIPATGVFVDELDFGRSAEEVREQLGAGDPLLDAVLLVRTVACDGQVSTGSAFALDVGGEPVLITNRHVVDRAASIGVRPLTGGPTERVRSHRVSLTRDVAVLTLADDTLTPTPLIPAQVVRMGAPIRIVGFPGGRPATATGSVAQVVSDRMLLDVSVQQGSSGSPVIDDDGEVVGIVTARTEDGRGLALPVSTLLDAVGSTVPAPAC